MINAVKGGRALCVYEKATYGAFQELEQAIYECCVWSVSRTGISVMYGREQRFVCRWSSYRSSVAEGMGQWNNNESQGNNDAFRLVEASELPGFSIG